jgi:hypothetical protein
MFGMYSFSYVLLVRTVHYALRTPQTTQATHTPHITQFTATHTLCTVHCSRPMLYTTHYRCTLHTAHCTRHTTHYTLHADTLPEKYTMYTARFTLHTALHTTRNALRTTLRTNTTHYALTLHTTHYTTQDNNTRHKTQHRTRYTIHTTRGNTRTQTLRTTRYPRYTLAFPRIVKQHGSESNSGYAATALHCTALHCTALHCTALHCTALRCDAKALRCTTLFPLAVHFALCCTTLQFWTVRHGTPQWCMARHRSRLYTTLNLPIAQHLPLHYNYTTLALSALRFTRFAAPLHLAAPRFA